MLEPALQWIASYLRTIGATIVGFWDDGVGPATPSLKLARDWTIVQLHTMIVFLRSAWDALSEAARPYLPTAFAALAPYSHGIAAAFGGMVLIGAIAGWALRSTRRRWRLRASLVEASLRLGPQTNWIELKIVMRNLQRHDLLVHSIQVIDPPGTTICDIWRAWQPAMLGVKFIAPELELTNSHQIERVLVPYNLDSYYFGGNVLQRSKHENPSQDQPIENPLHELDRRFYIHPPKALSKTIALRVQFICELRMRRKRRQELSFQCSLSSA